jgi:regulator of PEP synthase PpsR (kinase-PPPase family)
MYLAVQGWRVANLPLVAELPPPPELFQLDPRRVVGLVIAPERLVNHRQQRQRRLRLPADVAYGDLTEVRAEIAAARRLCTRHGFAILDVTDRTIEASASEIISLLGDLGHGAAR